MKRRQFLQASAAAPLLAALPNELFAQQAGPRPGGAWDPGAVRHLVPTVSDTEILVKASFARPLGGAPRMTAGGVTVEGEMTDTRGEFWQFRARHLEPGRRYDLRLTGLHTPWSRARGGQPPSAPASDGSRVYVR